MKRAEGYPVAPVEGGDGARPETLFRSDGVPHSMRLFKTFASPGREIPRQACPVRLPYTGPA